MTGAKAILIGFVFVVTLVALAIVALYHISPIGFGVAVGALGVALLLLVIMPVFALSVRVVAGGFRPARRDPEPTPTPAIVEGQYRLPPAASPMFLDQTSAGGWQVEQPALPAPVYRDA